MRFRDLLRAAQSNNDFLYLGVPCKVVRVTADQGVCVGFHRDYSMGWPPSTDKERADLNLFGLHSLNWVEAEDLYQGPPETLIEQVKACTCGAETIYGKGTNLHSSWCDVL